MSGAPLPVERLRRRHGEIYLIVAPPRTASTALARVLWQHPAVGWYSHEPFDLVFHRSAGPESAAAALERPASVRPPGSGAGGPGRGGERGEALVVKEMTFQVGGHFGALAALTSRPVVFLLRDPRLAIASRMRQLERQGLEPLFPPVESGWAALRAQVDECRDRGLPYALLDSGDLRNRPLEVLPPLFERLGLVFSPDFIEWEPAGRLGIGELGGLEGEQSAWYERVLSSRGLEPARSAPPELDSFPEERGFREHVRECLALYRALGADERRIG